MAVPQATTRKPDANARPLKRCRRLSMCSRRPSRRRHSTKRAAPRTRKRCPNRTFVPQLRKSYSHSRMYRTTRKDPNSTKRFCEGMLNNSLPAEDLVNADEARSAAGLGTVTQLADANDVDREADTFSAKADFDVQPTDTGDKLFAETETKSPIMNVASEVLASSLLHNVLQQAAATQQEAQQTQQAQQNAALAEQKAANLNSAKTDNQLATQSILAVWRSITATTRAQLLPQQRAWARKKDADCRVEAATTSTDPTDMEVARLNCDTRVTQERIASCSLSVSRRRIRTLSGATDRRIAGVSPDLLD